MMAEAPAESLLLDLPQGLSAAMLGTLGQLAAASVAASVAATALSTSPPAAAPFIWPILALSLAPAQLRELLRGEGDRFIVHETLTIRAGAALFVQDSPLQMILDQGGLSDNRLRVSFRNRQDAELAQLTSGLRHLTGQALAQLKSISLERVARGQPLRRVTTPPLTQQTVDAFVQLIQDPNPIHTDRAQAMAAGCADTVVPGALLAAMLEPALPYLLAEKKIAWRSLSVRFMGVLETGTPVTFATAGAPGPVERPLRVFLSRPDGMLVAIADIAPAH